VVTVGKAAVMNGMLSTTFCMAKSEDQTGNATGEADDHAQQEEDPTHIGCR
jgi:hypothetical protein